MMMEPGFDRFAAIFLVSVSSKRDQANFAEPLLVSQMPGNVVTGG